MAAVGRGARERTAQFLARLERLDRRLASLTESDPQTLLILITLATAAVAGVLGWAMWDAYMAAPWTRDGTVRAYVVTYGAGGRRPHRRTTRP
jgi:multidrug resistance efflux pump